MAEPLVTEVGTVVQSDPELKFTSGGHALTTFSIRVKEKDQEARFVRCAAWRDLAEHTAESVRKGDRVVVRGLLKTRTYEKADGTPGESTELNCWNVALDLSFVNAEVVRNERVAAADEAPAVADF